MYGIFCSTSCFSQDPFSFSCCHPPSSCSQTNGKVGMEFLCSTTQMSTFPDTDLIIHSPNMDQKDRIVSHLRGIHDVGPLHLHLAPPVMHIQKSGLQPELVVCRGPSQRRPVTRCTKVVSGRGLRGWGRLDGWGRHLAALCAFK